jgi:hypothetical protein
MTQGTKAVAIGLVFAIVAGVASIAHAQDDVQSDKVKIKRAHLVVTELRASDELAKAQAAVDRAQKQVAVLRAQLAKLKAERKRNDDRLIAVNSAALKVVNVNRANRLVAGELLVGTDMLAELKVQTQTPTGRSFLIARAGKAPVTVTGTLETKSSKGLWPTNATSGDGHSKDMAAVLAGRLARVRLDHQRTTNAALVQREMLSMMHEMRNDVRDLRKLVESLRPRGMLSDDSTPLEIDETR